MAYTTGTDGFADALNGAAVTITDAEGAEKDTAVSSKDSGFAFVLPAGSYTVQAKAEGYDPVSQKISLKEGEVKNINLELKASGIELTDYYSNISSLIEKAGLRQEADPLDARIVYSSEKTKIYFKDPGIKLFMVSNTDPGISVYGIKTGDSKDRIVSVFAEYGLAVPSTSTDGRMNVYLWDEAGLSDVICVSFTFDETGNVSQWYAVNGPEGEIASFYMSILRQAHDTGVTSFADWQIAYFNFLDQNYREHDMENQYECTLIYINDDDIPELYIEYGSTASGSLLAYFNGSEVVTLPMYTYGLTYIERENRFRDSGGHMDTYYDAVYAIEENGFREIASGNYGAADNSRVETDADGNPIYEYYWNDRETTEEGYGQALEKVFDSDRAVSPFGKYDSVAHMDGGFYSLWEIGNQILSAGM